MAETLSSRIHKVIVTTLTPTLATPQFLSSSLEIKSQFFVCLRLSVIPRPPLCLRGTPCDLPLQHQPSHSQHSDRLQIQVCRPRCLRSGFIQKYEKHTLPLVLKHFPSLSALAREVDSSWAEGQRSCPLRAASQGIRDPSCSLGWESKLPGFPGTGASSEENRPIIGLCFRCLCGPSVL